MRILLAQNSQYYPAHGGGDKSNRLLIEALAARGHECYVVARISRFGPAEHERYLAELAARSVPVSSFEGGVVAFRHNGVEVRVVTNHPNLRAYFVSQVAGLRPQAIVTSTDDPAQMLLEAALRAGEPRVVYLARATLALPFGPDCAFPSEPKTAMLRQADGVVGVSRYVAEYIRKWSGIEAAALPISLLEPGPWPALGRFDNEFVTLVNPCAVKGLSIFLELAARMPGVRFAAVPTWGTNARDRAALERHANVRVLDPVDDIDRLLRRTRVLLVPSLWAEARSRIVVEAMLRGVPVIASEVGGIPEAKMGVPYLLPVHPIGKYRAELDDQMVPVAEVPEQDAAPWEDALRRLLTDRAHYEEISRASRAAALAYAESLGAGPFEAFLEDVVRKPPARRAQQTESAAQSRIEQLSPERRRLLALRLRKAAAPSGGAWFAEPEQPARVRLFCFPSAGGGAAMFRNWREKLCAGVSVWPARLPGREGRAAEPALDRMQTLVQCLCDAIVPHLKEPFAFFGHSMGAAIAFELARELRRRGAPLPAALFVSAARAPQFRRGHIPPPEPADAELFDQLRRLEGIPEGVLANEELMRVLLPALSADAALYRNYVYEEAPPLPCVIRAYGGAEDPNVTREHLNAWSEQTASSFSVRLFSGGHFYLHSSAAFFGALAAELEVLGAGG